ncbi:hypothetical protein H3H54_15560 [Brachybacterium sp. Z12]|uniref:hypothetical protein n=1 Tax=Brachybacterium sp. Z12 TaxID=2759167 RepID=UPI001862B916|nr:hypothetical protein [Brachybacterium sp. Z12]QNN82401.1 hypothetical protein H3H54_15560 [Brachybacterium sp. Z12]
MHTEAAAPTSTEAGHPAHPAHSVSWRTHLLGAAFYTVGTCGMLGGLPPPLSDLGLGLGVLLLAIGTIIVSRAQIRHHGRASSLPAIGGPRSLLSAWMAAGPLLFHVLLPEATPASVSVLLSLLLGTVLYAVFRLEDAELTARATSKPAA